MAVITIIGAGMMGTGIGFPAADNGHEIRLVGTPLDRDIIDALRKTGVHPTLKRQVPAGFGFYQYEEVDRAISGADAIVSGVSSFGVDWFAAEVLPRIPEGMPVLCVTKGMMDEKDGTLTPYPVFYRRILTDSGRYLSINAVGGPCTSYELADHDQTTVSFCGEDLSILKRLKSLFETEYYHVSVSTDITGVECAVAMKNAYALAVTLAVGLSEARDGGIHYNSQAALFGQSVREMTALLRMTGGGADKLYLGAGDLYVTIFGGRTRLIGTLLGKGMPFAEAMEQLHGITLESVVIATRTARAVREKIRRGEANAADFPLLLHVDEILSGGKVDIPWNAFETEEDAGAARN